MSVSCDQACLAYTPRACAYTSSSLAATSTCSLSSDPSPPPPLEWSRPTEDKRAYPARGAATDDTGLQLGLVIKHRFPDLDVITPVNVATSCYKVSLLSSVLHIPLIPSTRTYSRGIPCKTPLLRICGLQGKSSGGAPRVARLLKCSA